jgi:hypothetical protein
MEEFRLISIDPGGTNGYAIWEEGAYLEDSGALDAKELFELVKNTKFHVMVIEEYRLYQSKAKTMIGNKFHTVQVIGVLKYLADESNIEVIEYPASYKKFWDNEKLKDLDLYTGVIHTRDAIRHGLHYFQFGEGAGNFEEPLSKLAEERGVIT